VVGLLVVALALGRGLATWRTEHGAVGSTSTVMASPSTRPSELPSLRFPARTADEVVNGMQSDPFVGSSLGGSVHIGTPLFVRGLRSTDANIWLVPQVDGTHPIGVWVVKVADDGFGTTTEHAGGPERQTLSVPPVSEADARTLGGLTNDPVIKIDLVWTRARPESAGLVSEIHPLWELSRSSGTIVYVTSDRLILASEVLNAVR
jgi:hypothetical protein